MSYTAGGIDPISRLREQIPDTDASAFASDEPLYSYLEASLSTEALLLYLPDTTSGVTAATVQVLIASSKLVLRLNRTPQGATDIELAPSSAVRTTRDVVDAVRDLDQGWKVGLSIGEDLIEWIGVESDGWIFGVSDDRLRCIAKHGRAGDLALTPPLNQTPAAVNAFDDGDKPVRLRFYLFASALGAIWRRLQAQGTEWDERRDGRTSIRRAAFADRIKHADQQAQFGIYAAGF